MSSSILVRPMVTADLERVLQIGASLPDAPHWPISAYEAALNPDAMPRRIALVAENAETQTVIGFAVAGVLVPEAELETIAVAGIAQRRGTGGLLLSSLLDDLKTEQVTLVHLEVRASNHAALALYRASGFNESGRRPRYYADPDEDAVIMYLRVFQAVNPAET